MKWNNLYFHTDAVKQFHIECVVISVTNLQDSGEVRSKSGRWIQDGAGIISGICLGPLLVMSL